ncbi:MAG: SPFH domain-containing protein [Clostridiales bacterium]|jgi:membrane protease subunit (stomatin/prohibitin family)|nr:SPFH domain-containing protein [Clostridiales bacterium]
MKRNIPPITCKSPGALFERIRIDERDASLCVIVNEFEEYGLIIKDGLVLDTLQGGKSFVFTKDEVKRGGVALAEAVFISKKAKIQLGWGTPAQSEFIDPAHHLSVRVGMNGTAGVQVANPRKFYAEIVGRNVSYDKDALRERVLPRLLSCVKSAAADYMADSRLTYLHLERSLDRIAEAVKPKLSRAFTEEYGLAVPELTIDGAIINADDKKALLARARQ